MHRIVIALAAMALATPAQLSAQSPQAIAEGASVWAQNCTRCHNARPSQERTDGQWRTIVLHMRARANLTRQDASLVTTFLQATNVPAPGAAGTVPGADSAGEVSADPSGNAAPDLDQLISYLRRLAAEPAGP